MIIDSLVHTTPTGRWFNTSYDASEARLLEEMDAANIRQAVLVGLAGYIDNDYIVQVTARHASRLIACGSFNPAASVTPQAAAHSVRVELADKPFAALKFHPRLNGYDPLDKRMLTTLDEIASWQNPPKIWLDTLFYRRGIILEKSPIDAIHTLINTYPMLTFMLLHGTGSTIITLAEAIRDCPNAYIDISFTLNRYQGSNLPQDIRQLILMFDQRIVFGSDFPEISIPDALTQTKNILKGLPDSKSAAVLGGNLVRIFALELK